MLSELSSSQLIGRLPPREAEGEKYGEGMRRRARGGAVWGFGLLQCLLGFSPDLGSYEGTQVAFSQAVNVSIWPPEL